MKIRRTFNERNTDRFNFNQRRSETKIYGRAKKIPGKGVKINCISIHFL